eukprot:13342187-Heterocapsa_arctica.AAC.1
MKESWAGNGKVICPRPPPPCSHHQDSRERTANPKVIHELLPQAWRQVFNLLTRTGRPRTSRPSAGKTRTILIP